MGIKVDSVHTAQSHSVKWLKEGVENNEKYGYFDAKIAIDNLTPERHQKILEKLRERKI